MEFSKTVLVTGGSRGIGASIAKRLATAGFDIWLNYHSSHDAANQVKEEIEAFGQQCLLLPFDVSDEEQVESVLLPLVTERPLYGFVHNAGVTKCCACC